MKTTLPEAAKYALADLEGIMPEFEASGDRVHPAWKTIDELKNALEPIELAKYAVKTMYSSYCLSELLRRDKELLMDVLNDIADEYAPNEVVGVDITEEQWNSKESKFDKMLEELVEYARTL